MKLYDEEELRKKNEKSKKIKNLILVSIIFTVILIVLIIGLIYYIVYNPNKITIYLNGKESETLENMIITKIADDGSTICYFPIREAASLFEYNSNNGDYGANVENTENCYIESENEVAIFTQDSNIIYKIDKTTERNNIDSEYEEVIVDNPIISENDILYADTEGFSKAFNLYIRINKKMKKIDITTLDMRIASAQKIVEDNNLGELDDKFANKKAILDNMMVIESEYDGKKGVRNYTTKEEILGFQYDDITYIPEKESFLIKKNDKVGIIGSDSLVRIKPQYDNLTLIDIKNGLYLAEDNKKYGILDEYGNLKVYFEYSKIGVDISEYKDNGLKSGYILLGKIIPAQKFDGKWIFFSIESQKNADGSNNVQCTKIENGDFDGIGCVTKMARGVTSNLMVIKDYNIIVVQKYNYYGFMDIQGKPALGLTYSDAYIETTSGQTYYYAIDRLGKQIQVIEELKNRGYNKIN